MNYSNRDWWKGAVVYQIIPRSFFDANCDGVGDLEGIKKKLSYVSGLGVDAIWICPFFKSPMLDFGYDIEDFRQIDPVFGDIAVFDDLVDAAHGVGLKVIIDQVLSHTSNRHPWFQESRLGQNNPKSDWYVWADADPDGSPPNNWLSVFGGSSWMWDAKRKQYYLHNFLPQQPDLNYHCDAVRDQILADVEFWCKRGVDGFRLDAINYLFHDQDFKNNMAKNMVLDDWDTIPTNPYGLQIHDHDKNRPETIKFLERLRLLLDKYGAIGIGEIGDDNMLPLMVEYTANRSRLHTAYSFGLLSEELCTHHIRNYITQFEELAADYLSWPCWSFGNHDTVRLMTRWKGGDYPKEFTRMIMAILFSLKGSACWYQGDELCLPEADVALESIRDTACLGYWPEVKGRDGCRTPMPWDSNQNNAGFSECTPEKLWLPISSDHLSFSVNEHMHDAFSPIKFMSDFLHWRNKINLFRDGNINFILENDAILGFSRSSGKLNNAGESSDSTIVCFFNISRHVVQLSKSMISMNISDARQLTIPCLPSHQICCESDTHLIFPPYGFGIFQ